MNTFLMCLLAYVVGWVLCNFVIMRMINTKKKVMIERKELAKELMKNFMNTSLESYTGSSLSDSSLSGATISKISSTPPDIYASFGLVRPTMSSSLSDEQNINSGDAAKE